VKEDLKCKICGSSAKLTFEGSWTNVDATLSYYQCQNNSCNFLYTDHLDRMSDDEVSALYNIPYWRDSMVREEMGQLVLDKVNLAKTVNPNLKSVLDVGCGQGLGVKALRDEGYEGYGYDVSPPKVCPEYITVGSRDQIDGQFDAITALEVMEHLVDPVEACQWIANLLPEGGVYVFSTYTFNSDKHDKNWWYLDHVGHVSLYTEKSLAILAKQTGFTVAANLMATHVWVKGDSVDLSMNAKLWVKHIANKISDPKYIQFLLEKTRRSFLVKPHVT
jgi:SAM-dependent methyltransferase